MPGMTSVRSRLLFLMLSVLLAAVPGCTSAGFSAMQTVPVAGPVTRPSIWVGAWGIAMTNADDTAGANDGGQEQSYRFLLYPTVSGTEERVRFSNVYGTTPITIGAARLAVGMNGSPAIDPTRDAPLTFGGKPGVVVGAGQVVVSDPVEIGYSFGETLDVSMYLSGAFGPMSHHNSLYIGNYRSLKNTGDVTTDSMGAQFTQAQTDWLLVDGIDVFGPYQGTIAMFGSSTTDGFHANFSSNQVYPAPNAPVDGQDFDRVTDWLARRLNAAGYQIGVVNEGIPGDTVTNDSSNQAGDVLNANQRIGMDVLSLPNLLGVVTYFGSIDIRSADCESAPAIEAATTQMVATAHAAKVPVILATLPPSAFCTNPAQPNFGPTPTMDKPYNGGAGVGSGPDAPNGGELQRIAFNQWVRAAGSQLPGVAGIVDYDQALMDPAHTSFMLPQYNSGDNQHMNGMGYGAEANAIPYNLLLP